MVGRNDKDGTVHPYDLTSYFKTGVKDCQDSNNFKDKRKIAHEVHSVLRWMMDNIFIRTDPAGNIKADKEKSTEKIDGVIATIMALDRAIRCGNDTSESVYNDRGLLVF